MWQYVDYHIHLACWCPGFNTWTGQTWCVWYQTWFSILGTVYHPLIEDHISVDHVSVLYVRDSLRMTLVYASLMYTLLNFCVYFQILSYFVGCVHPNILCLRFVQSGINTCRFWWCDMLMQERHLIPWCRRRTLSISWRSYFHSCSLPHVSE